MLPALISPQPCASRAYVSWGNVGGVPCSFAHFVWKCEILIKEKRDGSTQLGDSTLPTIYSGGDQSLPEAPHSAVEPPPSPLSSCRGLWLLKENSGDLLSTVLRTERWLMRTETRISVLLSLRVQENPSGLKCARLKQQRGFPAAPKAVVLDPFGD